MEEGFGGSGVRGAGVEGGVRGVSQNRPAKKKTQPRFLFDLGEKLKKAEKVTKVTFLYTPKSGGLGGRWKKAEKVTKVTFLYTPKSGVLEPV